MNSPPHIRRKNDTAQGRIRKSFIAFQENNDERDTSFSRGNHTPPHSSSSTSIGNVTSQRLFSEQQQQQQQQVEQLSIPFVGVLDKEQIRSYSKAKKSLPEAGTIRGPMTVESMLMANDKNNNRLRAAIGNTYSSQSMSSTRPAAPPFLSPQAQEVELLKNRVRGVLNREGDKSAARRTREQDQLQRDAREIEDWRMWHRDVRRREEEDAHQLKMQELEKRRASRKAVAAALRQRLDSITVRRGSFDAFQYLQQHQQQQQQQQRWSSLGGEHEEEDDDDDDEDIDSLLFAVDENEDCEDVERQQQQQQQQQDDSTTSTTTCQMIKKLRKERQLRKRRELQRWQRLSSGNSSPNDRFHANEQSQHEAATFQDLDAEEELLVVQSRLEHKVAVTNMAVCQHEERQQRAHIAEDEDFIWEQSMLRGFWEKGRRTALVTEQSRLMLREAREQRSIWFHDDFMLDFRSKIEVPFVKEHERIRQHDLFVLFDSLDERTQNHLMTLTVQDRERILDDLAVERFLKSKVNVLKRQKYSVVIV